MIPILFLSFLIIVKCTNVSGNQFPSFQLDDGSTFDNAENDSSNRTWLCPDNEKRQEYFWELYDNRTQKCYPPDTNGPCSSYENFKPLQFGSEYGVCKCGSMLSKSTTINRPLAKSPVDGNCYPLYEQASCKEEEWLSLEANAPIPSSGDSWKGVCMKNPCSKEALESKNETVDPLIIIKFLGFDYYKTREDFKCSDIETSLGNLHPLDINQPFWFLYEEKCYKTFTRGPCMEGQLIVFEGTRTTPACYDPITKFINDIGTTTTDNSFISNNIKFTDPNSGKSWLCSENNVPFNDEKSWKLYDNATNQCYSPFINGPCNGRFQYWSQASKGSEIGVCKNLSPLNTFKKLNRPIAESAKDGEVYLVYSKGNCNAGEWFVYDENWQGVCKTNPCLSEPTSDVPEVNTTELIRFLGYQHYNTYEDFQTDDIDAVPPGHPLDIHNPFWFLYKGKCVKYFSKGPCDQGEVLVFKGLNPIPICYNPDIIYSSLHGLAPASAPAGGGSGGLTATGSQKCNGCKVGNKCLPCSASDFS